MNSIPRRKILKAAAATAFAGTLASRASASTASAAPELFGGWQTDPKGNKHIPVVTIARSGEECAVTVEVKHPQSAEHHISNVRVYDENRIELTMIQFSPTLSSPRGTFNLRVAKGTMLYAVSDCNKHGLWFLEFKA